MSAFLYYSLTEWPWKTIDVKKKKQGHPKSIFVFKMNIFLQTKLFFFINKILLSSKGNIWYQTGNIWFSKECNWSQKDNIWSSKAPVLLEPVPWQQGHARNTILIPLHLLIRFSMGFERKGWDLRVNSKHSCIQILRVDPWLEMWVEMAPCSIPSSKQNNQGWWRSRSKPWK